MNYKQLTNFETLIKIKHNNFTQLINVKEENFNEFMARVEAIMSQNKNIELMNLKMFVSHNNVIDTLTFNQFKLIMKHPLSLNFERYDLYIIIEEMMNEYYQVA